MTDPMTDYDQAEYEAEAREDEQRREQYWQEAQTAALSRLACCDALEVILSALESYPTADSRTMMLRAFVADEGIPNLLRVIARALEAK